MALAAPWLAPHRAAEQFVDRTYAPPTLVHVRDADGWHAPFIRPMQMTDRLRSAYSVDASARAGLRDPAQPLLLFGADPLGRDVFSRVLLGARWSLGVSLAGACGALILGTLIGGLAGISGGAVDRWLMRGADFVLVLPAVYLVLVLRASLPLVLSSGAVFGLMALLFAVAAWPHVARGVRAVVAVERRREYVDAARAAGASRLRVLRHVLPAARGFLGVELILLVPALLSTEMTVSFLGLGFPEPTPSWGTMLQDAANVRVMTQAPWMLAPAAALFLVVLGVQLAFTRASGLDSLGSHASAKT
jgi:peptide/nickel transport system permease protein